MTAPSLAAWCISHILSTPTLLSTIRAELAPHIDIKPPVTIGKFTSPPELHIKQEILIKSCPLLASSIKETLRLTSRNWTLQTVERDEYKLSVDSKIEAYLLRKGQHILIPHELSLRDPQHYQSPEHFIPDRFVVHSETQPAKDQGLTGTSELFGNGAGLFGVNDLILETCMSFVAGILMVWDIEPVVNERGRKEWKLPKKGSGYGVVRPDGDIRVSIRARKIPVA